MTNERRAKLIQRANETVEDTLRHLNMCGRCAILRPTGFGKTTLVCRIAAMSRYKCILYVYPSNEVREAAERNLKGTKTKIYYVPYMELSLRSKDAREYAKLVSKRCDLIIFDEFHHMGAEKASITIEKILETINLRETHVIGASATPRRMSGPDVIDKFFGNHMCYYYGADDAIRDGIMLPIHYVFAPRGYEAEFNKNLEAVKRSLKAGLIAQEVAREQEIYLRKQRDIAVEIMNVPNILREAVQTVYGAQYPNYMSFIVFCYSVEVMKRKRSEIEKWFSIAFGNNFRLRITEVSSYSEHKAGREYLKNMKPTPGLVDVVIAINLVNEGYHFKDLTGVVMLRPTRSNIIFTQQLGRCTSVDREVQPIAIDLVNNVGSKPLYNKTQLEFLDEIEATAPTMVATDIGKRLAAMSWIDPKRIVLVDKVAEIQTYAKRIDYLVSRDEEEQILDMRINQGRLVGNIAIRLGLPYWMVMRVIEKHKNTLIKHQAYFCASDSLEFEYTGKRPAGHKSAKITQTGRLLVGYYENLRQICSEPAAIV